MLWLDAHPDMNTLTSTLSGHLHGTPMAYALGMPSFEGIFPPVPAPLDPANICMMGLRSVDEAEHQFIRDLGIDVYDMRRIDELGVAKPMEAVFAAELLRQMGFCMSVLMSIFWIQASHLQSGPRFQVAPHFARRI